MLQYLGEEECLVNGAWGKTRRDDGSIRAGSYLIDFTSSPTAEPPQMSKFVKYFFKRRRHPSIKPRQHKQIHVPFALLSLNMVYLLGIFLGLLLINLLHAQFIPLECPSSYVLHTMSV